MGTGTFPTDRGDQILPAWLFSLSGVDDPAAVLAVSKTAQWSPPGRAAPSLGAGFVSGATIGSDHRTLTAGFTGAQAGVGPCTASYRLNLNESNTAVVITVIEYSHTSATTVCTLVGYPRTATAVLSAPLGARVVVDAVSGEPIAVAGNS